MVQKYKKKVFIPKTEPRYLRYQVRPAKWKLDLKYYNVHRKRVFKATHYIDADPPKMDPRRLLDFTKMHRDLSRADEVDRENKEILRHICAIERKGGNIDNINRYAYFSTSKWPNHLRKMTTIEKRNKIIHRRLNDAESYYQRKGYAEQWKIFRVRIHVCSKFPFTINKKTSLDKTLRAQPSISGILPITTNQHPLCYLEFKVDGGEYLGRIIIELYHDHVPVTVQNFLGICKGENDLTFRNCLVHRIVKGQYLETGDITKGTGLGGLSIYGETFDEESHMLKHTKAGVLSMIRVRDQKNDTKFCITLSNMEKIDKKNVVFGKVIRGSVVLTKINGYGRFIGKPLMPIRIVECGVVCVCNE